MYMCFPLLLFIFLRGICRYYHVLVLQVKSVTLLQFVHILLFSYDGLTLNAT